MKKVKIKESYYACMYFMMTALKIGLKDLLVYVQFAKLTKINCITINPKPKDDQKLISLSFMKYILNIL